MIRKCGEAPNAAAPGNSGNASVWKTGRLRDLAFPVEMGDVEAVISSSPLMCFIARSGWKPVSWSASRHAPRLRLATHHDVLSTDEHANITRSHLAFVGNPGQVGLERALAVREGLAVDYLHEALVFIRRPRAGARQESIPGRQHRREHASFANSSLPEGDITRTAVVPEGLSSGLGRAGLAGPRDNSTLLIIPLAEELPKRFNPVEHHHGPRGFGVAIPCPRPAAPVALLAVLRCSRRRSEGCSPRQTRERTASWHPPGETIALFLGRNTSTSTGNPRAGWAVGACLTSVPTHPCFMASRGPRSIRAVLTGYAAPLDTKGNDP